MNTTTIDAIIQAHQEERTRLGQELHDNVNQILASAQLFLSQLSPGSGEFSYMKDKAIKMLGLAIEEIRRLSRDMVLPDFREDGLTGSILHLTEELQDCKCFAIHFIHNNKRMIESMDPNRKVALFRIVQEQVKNILKYSQAKNVVIDLHCCQDQVRLEIADDGVGFDPAKKKRGLGLSNINERAGLFKGKMLLQTAPGRGCTLIVNLPLNIKKW